MIDYEKLKKTHELAEEYSNYTDECIKITMYFQPRREAFIYAENFHEDDERWHEICRGYEPLIDKLTELTQPKAKYKIGDKLWLVGNFGKPITAKILAIMGGDVNLAFDDGTCRHGIIKELYPTKQSLIEAQIAYWHKLWNNEEGENKWGLMPLSRMPQKEDEECQHENDGNYYTRLGPSPFTMSKLNKNELHLFQNNRTKCVNCGEYYL